MTGPPGLSASQVFCNNFTGLCQLQLPWFLPVLGKGKAQLAQSTPERAPALGGEGEASGPGGVAGSLPSRLRGLAAHTLTSSSVLWGLK